MKKYIFSWSVNTATTLHVFFLFLKSFFKVLRCSWSLITVAEGCMYFCMSVVLNRHSESINVGLNLKLILSTSLLSCLWFPMDFNRSWMLSYVGNLFKHSVNWNDCFDMTKYGHNRSLKTVLNSRGVVLGICFRLVESAVQILCNTTRRAVPDF